MAFIHLTSTTPGIGKVRFNVAAIAMYFKSGPSKSTIALTAMGNPQAMPSKALGMPPAILPAGGLMETVTETPEEIDKMIADA